MKREFKKFNPDMMVLKGYHKIGDDVVLYYDNIYNYDDDCWRYAPDVMFKFAYDSSEAEEITEDEARKIVERNKGKGFEKKTKILYVSDDDGNFVGV